jgi:ribosomal protein L7/L12
MFLESLLNLFSGGDRSSLRAQNERIERKLDRLLAEDGLPVGPHPLEAEIDQAIAARQTILAIKLVREASGAGLAEAKRAVEQGTWRDLIR